MVFPCHTKPSRADRTLVQCVVLQDEQNETMQHDEQQESARPRISKGSTPSFFTSVFHPILDSHTRATDQPADGIQQPA